MTNEQQAMPLAGVEPAAAPARRAPRATRKPAEGQPADVEYTEQDGDWLYETDNRGDTRATNLRLGLRTRLKRGVAAARADVHSGRLQKRINGEWVDNVR